MADGSISQDSKELEVATATPGQTDWDALASRDLSADEVERLAARARANVAHALRKEAV